MGNVHYLHMVETGHVDFSVIAALQKTVGVNRYQEIADEVIFELTEKISRFSKVVIANNAKAIIRHGTEIKLIAAKIGLCGVVDVTQAALAASARADLTALSALNARLVRIAEGSLFLLVEIDIQAP